MDSDSTKADVEARLRETADTMSDRLASLQEEMASTGTSLRDWVARNPVKSVGGMLAAGLAVGFLFGGGRSRREGAHTELLDQYVDALKKEVGDAVAEGVPPREAFEEALRDRVPLVVSARDGAAEEGQEESGRSVLAWGAGFIASTLFREVIREVLTSLLSSEEAGEMAEPEALE